MTNKIITQYGVHWSRKPKLVIENISIPELVNVNLSGCFLSLIDTRLMLVECNLWATTWIMTGGGLTIHDCQARNMHVEQSDMERLVIGECKGANIAVNHSIIGLVMFDLTSLEAGGMNHCHVDRIYFMHSTFEGVSFVCSAFEEIYTRDSTFKGVNWSQTRGLLDPKKWLKDNFNTDENGCLIVYKAFGNTDYPAPPKWVIEPGSFIEENVNRDVYEDCACGVNFGTKQWVRQQYPGAAQYWECRIWPEDFVSIVVPVETIGKARCGRLQLVGVINDYSIGILHSQF